MHAASFRPTLIGLMKSDEHATELSGQGISPLHETTMEKNPSPSGIKTNDRSLRVKLLTLKASTIHTLTDTQLPEMKSFYRHSKI